MDRAVNQTYKPWNEPGGTSGKRRGRKSNELIYGSFPATWVFYCHEKRNLEKTSNCLWQSSIQYPVLSVTLITQFNRVSGCGRRDSYAFGLSEQKHDLWLICFVTLYSCYAIFSSQGRPKWLCRTVKPLNCQDGVSSTSPSMGFINIPTSSSLLIFLQSLNKKGSIIFSQRLNKGLKHKKTDLCMNCCGSTLGENLCSWYTHFLIFFLIITFSSGYNRVGRTLM